jgi:diaminopimelate decarboxylase/aspartate kinase
MTHLDVGGGLSIPYKPTDTPFDLSALDATLFTVKQQYPQITFCVEPGRYLVAESGVILTRINQLKSKGGFKFIGLGVGMNALIRPALYDSYHHIVNLSKFHPQYLQMAAADLSADTNVHNDLHFSTAAPIEQPLVVNVVGPICESGDFLGKNRLFPQASNEDDIVLIDAAGAYGKVMSSNYNLRGNFREVLAEFE